MNEKFEYENYVDSLDEWDRIKEFKSVKKKLNKLLSIMTGIVMLISIYIGIKIITAAHLSYNSIIAIIIAIVFFILLPATLNLTISKLIIHTFYWLDNKNIDS